MTMLAEAGFEWISRLPAATVRAVHTTHSPEETRRLAAELAAGLQPGDVLALHGGLGAGKTCFVQGLADGLGVAEPVTSPTYTLVQEYDGRLPLVHVDLYRLDRPAETHSLGLDEYIDGGDVVLAMEWPERAGDLPRDGVIHVHIEPGPGPDDRRVRVERATP